MPPPPADLPLIVDFDKVAKTYDHGTPKAFTSIRDVSFQVEDRPDIGEFVGILGPSGCGKSTVLRLIVTGPGPDRGFVFQDYSNFPHRTVIDNVAFGLECAHVAEKERRTKAMEWIQKVGLDPLKDGLKYPHQLSGGMNQRVAIARTLIMEPKIILMDEPFGALDPTTRQSMQDLLVKLWRELEATVFFVTHDIAEAVYLGDRVYIFSPSPGTIRHQLRVSPPDRPARQMQAERGFQDSVQGVRAILEKLELEKTAAPTT
jgi:NitT/TauT family transport system ATP-binding protein